ncbi:trans-4-hydroxy-L-proline dehydratase [Natranaerobius thermophilus]|uniref:Formate C-acetyltransferase n=1 Tax=Natranaerobius thermophilus (strain ATCC BAA-1301 / DSM 18059 / JW/NM-WN-LF) TaxID=457570 RepID=B2A1A1_NATTJ|nr:trans-4-hydroxy-L-proline dehydratase [Natranaerobius thermophilus]ACB86039.1 Formate C-acetyltransferase [Natranaerobius thermophilus JW/NM-WN-LF]
MENNSRNSESMSPRVKKLREQSVSKNPKVSVERAILVTQAYKKYDGNVSIPILRALTFKHILENKSISINDGELIVGERGPAPQEVPTYPELCTHSITDLEIIHDREKVFFEVDETVKKIQDSDIIPFWKGKSMREKIFDNMSREWLDCYEAGIFTEFMEQRAPGHTVADGKIYQKGLLDFRDDIDLELKNIDEINDPQAYEKSEQLKAMRVCIDALIEFAQRYANIAEELAQEVDDSHRKEELLKIAEICKRVPAKAPRNFWEALQYYWFVHLGVITELNTWDSFCPGRLDQHLYPFYLQDLNAGELTRGSAKELLQCFWIKFNNQPAPPKVGTTLKESGTYTDFCNINIGGVTPEGFDGVNDVSYLLLEVIDEMQLVQPSTNIQVSKQNPNEFIKEAGKIIRKGWGQPSVFNTDAVISELLNQGKDLVDARCGGTSGCVEAGTFGKESYILTGYFNLTKILELTLYRGVDPRSGKQIGLKTDDPETFDSFQDLIDAFNEQLNYFIDIKIRGNNIIEKLYDKYMPSPFLSVIIDDCIKKAKDYNSGGARYNTRYIQGVGIGTITDSLSAIKHHIFEKQNYTWNELLTALQNNFEGFKQMRGFLKNKTPRYGNDDDSADDLMKEVFQRFYDAVNGRKTMTGGTYRINMLPTTCHVYFGSVIGATPEGRLRGTPLSEGISPVQSADQEGPTAALKSAAKMDHIKTGGTLLNLKFTPQVLQGEEGLLNLVYLVRSYFRMNGHHVQFNVVDAETLKDAQRNPDSYRNLIVRVAGYSDYFNNLNENLQNEIIKRTEHSIG